MNLKKIDFPKICFIFEKNKTYCFSKDFNIFFEVLDIIYCKEEDSGFLKLEFDVNSLSGSFDELPKELLKKIKQLINISFDKFLEKKMKNYSELNSCLWITGSNQLILYKEKFQPIPLN